MSWLSYADDAGRELPESFLEALSRIASGRYDLKKVDRSEYGLGEQVKNVLDSAYSRWMRDARRGEEYLEEMMRQRDMAVREQAKVTGLDKMVNDAINENAADVIGLDKETKSAVLRGQAQELLDTDLGRGRMEINEALRRQNLTIDDLSDNDLRKIIDYLEQRKKMRGM